MSSTKLSASFPTVEAYDDCGLSRH